MKQIAVTAKFKIGRITEYGESCKELELVPDYEQGRNADWAEATPAGVIRLSITNPSALEYLLGEELADVTGQIPYNKPVPIAVTLERE